MTSRVVFTVWDEDTVNDEKIGTMLFDLKTIMDRKNDPAIDE
jgi:hypothetical protein